MKHLTTLFVVAALLGLVGVADHRGTTATGRAITPAPTTTLSLPTPATLDRTRSGSLDEWGSLPPYGLERIPPAASTGITAAAVGAHHALALTTGGRVVGWGTNLTGELTIPTSARTNVVQVAVGRSHSVALNASGAVVFWGSAVAAPLRSDTPPTDVVRIAAGDTYTLLLRANDTVVAYGSSAYRTIPAALTGKPVVAIAAGATAAAALTDAGTVVTWGETLALPALAASDITAIWAGGPHVVALRRDGRLVITGGTAAFAADPRLPVSTIPPFGGEQAYTVVDGMAGATAVEFASWGIGIVRRGGMTVALPYDEQTVPVDFPTGGVYSLGMSAAHAAGAMLRFADSVALTATAAPDTLSPALARDRNTLGYLRVWGGNGAIRTLPEAVDGVLLRHVAAGARHIAALRADGRVVAWGDDTAGQTDVPADLQTAVALHNPLRVVMLAAGAAHTLALRANGTVVAWGSNDSGQSTVPAGLTGVVQVAAGVRHSVALKENGTIVVWGDNSYGQQNQPAVTGAVKIAAGGWHTLALRQNRTVVGWGRNDNDQLNLPSGSAADIAATLANSAVLFANGQVQVSGGDEWNQTDVPTASFLRIGAGAYHFVGITSSGQFAGWGLNGDGQVISQDPRLQPFLVTGGATYTAMLYRPGPAGSPTATPTGTVARSVPPVPTAGSDWTSDGLALLTAGDTFQIADYPLIGYAFGSGNQQVGVTAEGDVIFTGTAAAGAPCSMIDPVGQPAHGRDVVSVALSPQLGVLLHRDRSLYAWAGCDGAGVGIPATHIPLSYRTAVQEYALNAAELPDGDPDAANHLVILTLDDRIWSNKYRLPAFPKPIRHIAATDDAVGVLAEDGTVWVSDARYTPPASVTGIVELAAGDRHFVALTSAGGVVSWGADEANVGVLDVPHDATRDVVQVRAAGHSSAALHSDGTVTIWGEYPTETTAHIAYLNTLGTSGDIFIGAGQIALLMRARAPVVRATATPVALPTGYPENANPVLRANQIGKFSFDGALPATSVSFPGAVYRAGVSATQSTTDGAATAALLIDGVSDTPDRSGVSAATTSETHPWVELDLGTERDIAAVTVYAAQTGTLVDGVQRSDIRRLDGTLVMLSSTSLGDVRGIGTLKAAARTWKCAVSDSQVTGCPDAAHSVETVTFPAGTRARYVRIQSSRTDALIIHEVEVTTAASDYTCTGLLCPAVADELDGTTMTRALRFRDADGHEASSVNSYALTGDFTVHYALRRDSADRHDVALSTGQPGATRRFLVLGVDSENRAYCNFTGDDLRSGAWYPDTVWHRYTCTYDATTRVRKLYRDGTLVSQDIALSAFTPPAGPVWLGRRADTMVGLNGAIADVVVENRVWSDAEVAAAIVPGALAAHAPQLGSSPNRAVLRCDTSATCPRIERNPTGAHNGPYAVFSAQDRYTLGNIAANGAVTLSLWAKPHRLDHDQMLAARVNPDGSGMYLAIESGALSCSFVTGSGVTRAVRTITEALTADELDLWHMYSCAYDNTLHRARLFRDGVSVASANSIPALTFSTGVVFGAQPATTTIAEGELTLPIDDIAVYDTMLSDAKVWLLYADTLPDPTLPTHTSVPGVTLTTSPVPSATQTFTALPTAPRTRTRLLASLTPTNAPFPTQTATPSFTRSRTATRTQTPTRTLSLTPSETLTRTATVSTRTLVTTASRTPTITRTPLVITRTWMAKRSPTYGAQTRTATALMYQQTITAYRITQTAQARWTATRTLTAYPLPPTETVVAYPGP